MKTPTTCPKCHGPLLNSELSLRDGVGVWKKTCTDKLNHHFTCVTKKHDDNSIDIIIIGINRDNQVQAYWNITTHVFVIFKGPLITSISGLTIPWVEPDLSQYDKLVKKIKTYITFS